MYQFSLLIVLLLGSALMILGLAGKEWSPERRMAAVIFGLIFVVLGAASIEMDYKHPTNQTQTVQTTQTAR